MKVGQVTPPIPLQHCCNGGSTMVSDISELAGKPTFSIYGHPLYLCSLTQPTLHFLLQCKRKPAKLAGREKNRSYRVATNHISECREWKLPSGVEMWSALSCVGIREPLEPKVILRREITEIWSFCQKISKCFTLPVTVWSLMLR